MTENELESLQKENAHLKRENQILKGDHPIDGRREDEDYWRKRCLYAENKLGVMEVKSRNDANKAHKEFSALRKVLVRTVNVAASLQVGESISGWIEKEFRKELLADQNR